MNASYKQVTKARYIARVAELAEGAREGGLKF